MSASVLLQCLVWQFPTPKVEGGAGPGQRGGQGVREWARQWMEVVQEDREGEPVERRRLQRYVDLSVIQQRAFDWNQCLRDGLWLSAAAGRRGPGEMMVPVLFLCSDYVDSKCFSARLGRCLSTCHTSGFTTTAYVLKDLLWLSVVQHTAASGINLFDWAEQHQLVHNHECMLCGKSFFRTLKQYFKCWFKFQSSQRCKVVKMYKRCDMCNLMKMY